MSKSLILEQSLYLIKTANMLLFRCAARIDWATRAKLKTSNNKTGTILKRHFNERKVRKNKRKLGNGTKLAMEPNWLQNPYELATKMVRIGDLNVVSLFTEPFE